MRREIRRLFRYGELVQSNVRHASKISHCLAAIYVSSCALAAATEPAVGNVNLNLPARLRELWDLTEVRQAPLAPEIVEERKVDGFVVRGVYFTSEQTDHGQNRVYCGYARPKDAEKRPPLVVVHGGGGRGSIDTALTISKLLRVPVISMDWSGEASENEHATQFVEPTASTATITGRSSYAWHIVVAIRRTIDYLATLPKVDLSRVVVLGGSWGSYYGHLATATDPRITDFVGNSGAGGWDDSYSILAAGIQKLPRDERQKFLATLDPIVYAPYCRARISMLAPTNDEFYLVWRLGPALSGLSKVCGQAAHSPHQQQSRCRRVFTRHGDKSSSLTAASIPSLR